jgi:hypothetical protein
MSRSTIDFDAAGKSWSLRVSNRAEVRYQRENADETFLEGLAKVEQRPSDKVRLAALLRAAMSHHEGITEDVVLDVMDDLGLSGAIRLLADAFREAYPEAAAAGDAAGNSEPAKSRKPKVAA